MSALSVLPGRAGLLHDRLLVQAPADDVDDLALLTRRSGSGVVLTGEHALDAADRLRAARPDLPVLVDRRRYAGCHRVPGTARFDPDWIAGQRRLNVPTVLTDSGHIGPADLDGLHAVLGQTRSAGPDVTAVLSLHPDWLENDLPLLCRAVADHEVPVALVLNPLADPPASLDALYGLTTVLALPVPVAVLGPDVSVLGAIAFGASWAATGVRGSPRHLRPVAAPGGQGPGPSGVNVLVDPALALVSVERVAAAWAATPQRPSWRCDCQVCQGRTMDWMITASRLEAIGHTVQRLLDRRDALTSLPPGSLRRQSWQAQCGMAELEYHALARAGVPWQVPRQLRQWQEI